MKSQNSIYSKGHSKVSIPFPSRRASVSLEWHGHVNATTARLPFDVSFRAIPIQWISYVHNYSQSMQVVLVMWIGELRGKVN